MIYCEHNNKRKEAKKLQKKKKGSLESAIKEKIQYLGLNFERVPKSLIATENLNFKALKGYDEKQYKQYRFIKISDIDILLTPTHRLDSLNERYDQANPLYMYLDSEEENASRYATFLNMLKKVDISDVENVEVEQKMLAEQIPFKVKFNGNYLWQIYYSEYADKYFMLVPTEDSDYSTFFYLLKKKIENKKNDMIFVPISYLEYSGNILKKTELKDLENFLWLFTNDYPSIYEVTDKKKKETLQIIGETEVYGKIKTLYKNVFSTTKEANKFFKLLKALFILELQLPHYYKFNTAVNEKGELELYLDDKKIQYENLVKFVLEQYKKSLDLKEYTNLEIKELNEKLIKLKEESLKLEKEYLEKEKVISTFLECKKTFFGKMKYYFTMGKNSKKVSNKKNKKEHKKESKESEGVNLEKSNIQSKFEDRNYTLDELVISFKELEVEENSKKNIVQDINAIKLKNKNLKKKIENATLYINEINKHKKSIFEFWKYSNKDEVAALEEGEAEEVNVSKIEKVFNFDEDFEAFGEKVDKNQRLKFTDSELDGSYIASTDLLPIISDILSKKNVELTEVAEILKKLRQENSSSIDEDGESEEFDLFGDDSTTNTKQSKIGNKAHREVHRNKLKILEINKDIKPQDLRKKLLEIGKDILKAINKNTLDEDLYMYKASEEKIDISGLQAFSLNEQKEINESFKSNEDKIYLYRLKLPKGSNFVAISNIILYNNKNMTLPVGMQESTKIIVDTNSLSVEELNTKQINVKRLKDEKNDFSDLVLKNVEIIELG